jgi:hypothetical protein
MQALERVAHAAADDLHDLERQPHVTVGAQHVVAADREGDDPGYGAGGLQARELDVEQGRRRRAVGRQQREAEIGARRDKVTVAPLREVVVTVAREQARAAAPWSTAYRSIEIESPRAT